MHRHAVVIPIMPLLLLFAGPQPARALPIDATWTGGEGTWSTAGAWSTGVVPNNGADTYAVFVDGGADGTASILTVNGSFTIDSLTVDAGDTVRIANGQALAIAAGPIVNDGELGLSSTGSLTRLFIEGAASLAGDGRIVLSSTAQNRVEGIGEAPTLAIAAGATQTFSRIGGTLPARSSRIGGTLPARSPLPGGSCHNG